jgi:hypothetical protein
VFLPKNITVSWYVEPSSPIVTNFSVKCEASIFRVFSEDDGSMFFLNVGKQSVKSTRLNVITSQKTVIFTFTAAKKTQMTVF